MYEIKRAKRLSQAFVHFVTARASLFTDHKMSGLPIRARYTICKQTVDNPPTDSFFSSSLNWWWSMHGVATLPNCWVVLFASSQHLSIHSLPDLPCRKTKKIWLLHQVSLKLWSVVFPGLQQKPWIRSCPCSLSQCHYLLYTLFEYNPNIRGREMMLVLPSQRLSWEFSKSVPCFLFCLPFWYLPQTQTRIVLLLGWHRNISGLKLFPNSLPKELSQITWRVTVQISLKRNDWVFHTGPWFGQFVLR